MSEVIVTVKRTSNDTAQRMEQKRQRVENHAIACADIALEKHKAMIEQKAMRRALKQAKRSA
jgi:hypothetical protein